MLRLSLFFASFCLPVLLLAQFSPYKYPLHRGGDPVRNILHIESVGAYNVPREEMTIYPTGIRWNESLPWLVDMETVNWMTVLFRNPGDSRLYVISRGLVRGAGVRLPTPWAGQYIVEIWNDAKPLVMEVRRDSTVKVVAYVVYD